MEGNGYRQEYFLLDTGSPNSILMAECADNIVKYGSDIGVVSDPSLIILSAHSAIRMLLGDPVSIQ